LRPSGSRTYKAKDKKRHASRRENRNVAHPVQVARFPISLLDFLQSDPSMKAMADLRVFFPSASAELSRPGAPLAGALQILSMLRVSSQSDCAIVHMFPLVRGRLRAGIRRCICGTALAQLRRFGSSFLPVEGASGKHLLRRDGTDRLLVASMLTPATAGIANKRRSAAARPLAAPAKRGE
jgi:hypothetical protein